MKGMTFKDYRKLVNVFGWDHPFTTIIWNAMSRSDDHDVSEEFEQIYHFTVRRQVLMRRLNDYLDHETEECR